MYPAFEPDKSGINSLGGFSYQIRVFVYYLSKLEEGMQLEFEAYDDVSLTKINSDNLDSNEEKFKTILTKNHTTSAIQVKRTTINDETAQQVLLNWILLEGSDVKVSKYVLLTEESYGNEDNIFKLSCEDFFELVTSTTKSVRATIGKVKKLYGHNYRDFQERYESIKRKYSFKTVKDIDEEIAGVYSILFRRAGVINEIIYFQRIKALLEKVTSNIIESVNKKDSYVMTHGDFMKLIEHISNEIKDNNPIMDYISFKRLCSIDTSNLTIANSREFKQLELCDLPLPLIEQHLVYCFYYEHFRLTYSEMNKVIKVENVEETAFENYTIVKHTLERMKTDTPFDRLEGTKNKVNSYADNEQIKYGVVIYLTKDEMEDRQISWKEE
ncbi:hypothetical protein [Metabacillus fastidiosus]|uniref:hypothetical protein n=1 Tax=Metabacillus fastidiosus TaxID=1458 RepID=UPI003D26666B